MRRHHWLCDLNTQLYNEAKETPTMAAQMLKGLWRSCRGELLHVLLATGIFSSRMPEVKTTQGHYTHTHHYTAAEKG